MTGSTKGQGEGAPRPEEVADCDPLYCSALAVERDDRLASEMAEWEEAAVADGLFRSRRL